MCWINDEGPINEIVLSSRVRLARNINKIPFPSIVKSEEAKEIIKQVKEAYENGNKDFDFFDMKNTSTVQKQVLLENHLISPDLIKKGEGSGALISNDKCVSIMINEEDHIRIQTIYGGLQIRKAWDEASKIDDILEKNIQYAFEENWGYLTSCPTNVGTGMRASVMVHLPALNISGNINKLLQAVVHLGLTIRGLYGEGTDIVGNIFQISNQITLGRSEEEIVENLTAVTNQIIEKEKEARSLLISNSKIQVEDKIWRSWGLMKNARIMQSYECLRLISDVRLGVDLDILPKIPLGVLNGIMIETQSANIQIKHDHELNATARDIIRAEIVRNRLRHIE